MVFYQSDSISNMITDPITATITPPATSPIRVILTLIVLATSLLGCGSVGFSPDPSKNYRIELWKTYDHSWKEKFEQGMASIHLEAPMLRSSTDKNVVRWRNQLEKLKGLPKQEQLEKLNRAVNADVFYLSDYQHWQRNDQWGFPLETLTEGGDCEDIALLKMISLHYLGWDIESMYILVGYSMYGDEPASHAVLLVNDDRGSQIILDSLETDLQIPSEDHYFKPMFALTREHMYMVQLK